MNEAGVIDCSVWSGLKSTALLPNIGLISKDLFKPVQSSSGTADVRVKCDFLLGTNSARQTDEFELGLHFLTDTYCMSGNFYNVL